MAMYYMHILIFRNSGIINLAMNAGKFVSSSSHQHNTSLHSYLHPSSATTPSLSTISPSSQQQSTSNTIPLKGTHYANIATYVWN